MQMADRETVQPAPTAHVANRRATCCAARLLPPRETCDEHADVAVSFPFAMAALGLGLANRHPAIASPVADCVQRCAGDASASGPTTTASVRNARTGQLSASTSRSLGSPGFRPQAGTEYVESSFASLIDDLKSDKCDVAMFAVGMTPQRVAALRFSRPLSGQRHLCRDDQEQPCHHPLGGHRPPRRARGRAGRHLHGTRDGRCAQAGHDGRDPPADTRERELEAGRVDVFMTDYPYSRRLLDNADWARLVAPPTPPCAALCLCREAG